MRAISSFSGRGAYHAADPYAYAPGANTPAGYHWDFVTENGVKINDDLTGQFIVDLVAD